MSLTLIVPFPGTAVPLMNFVFLTFTALRRDTDKLNSFPNVTHEVCNEEVLASKT